MLYWKRFAMLAVAAAVCGVGASVASAAGAAAYGWGYNSYAELGDGTTTWRNSPVAVSGLSSGVTAIAPGMHGLAIMNGGVWAWGYNADGQVGDGTNRMRLTPVPLGGAMSSGVIAIAAGNSYSFAIKNGGVWAWGENGNGQLGDGTTNGRFTPVPLSGQLASGVTAIAAGNMHSLAIQNGGVWAWGYNLFGQVGDGTTINRSSPVAVSGLSSGVTAIAAGTYHNLALKDGGVWAWGFSLGMGTGGANENTPAQVIGLSSGVTAIAAGDMHRLAVRNGGVWAWGDNEKGQLGDGTTLGNATPFQVDPSELTNIVAVAASGVSSYALSADGSLWAWGDNSRGQLGLGTTAGFCASPQHLLPPDGYIYTSIETFPGAVHALATLAPVPEPGTLSFLLAGTAGLLARRRRGDGR